MDQKSKDSRKAFSSATADEDILNPFLDKKEKKQKQYTFKIKNFKLSYEDTDHPENQNKRNAVTEFEKEVKANKERKRIMYYENKQGTESMSSNISRIDDSFTDFIPEAKFENNVTKLLGSLAGVDQKEAEKAADTSEEV